MGSELIEYQLHLNDSFVGAFLSFFLEYGIFKLYKTHLTTLEYSETVYGASECNASCAFGLFTDVYSVSPRVRSDHHTVLRSYLSDAVEYCHALSIHHRNLKPENILLLL